MVSFSVAIGLQSSDPSQPVGESKNDRTETDPRRLASSHARVPSFGGGPARCRNPTPQNHFERKKKAEPQITVSARFGRRFRPVWAWCELDAGSPSCYGMWLLVAGLD